MRNRHINSMHWLIFAVIALAVAGCASIGRPQGGPRDEKPPVYAYSNPPHGSTNVNKDKISIVFDENIQLKDAFNKVIVSPVQKNTPKVSSNGKHITVALQDSLIPNTTYTIDFGDAIQDLNEGNILDGFAYAFSTGDSIDSLSISGIVLEARTLEPAQGMLVGVYSNFTDTTLATTPFDRVSRTNQLGQFTIHNLKPGSYRVFALNDINRDYKWDRTEDIAFYDEWVTPYATTIEVVDTLRSSLGVDSLSTRQGTAFFPNDLLLTWFNEDYKSQYLKDYVRPDRRRILINMAAPADSLPRITVAKGADEGRDISDWALMRTSQKLDSLEYWITDSAVLNTDSLFLSVSYLRTDTNDLLTWRTDTLKFFFRDPVKKEDKKKKKDEEADTLPPKAEPVSIKAVTATNHDVYMPAILEVGEPIADIAAEGVHLEVLYDTLWLPVEGVRLVPDSANLLQRRRMAYEWEPGEKYRLTLDSAAVSTVYGKVNNAFKHEFTVKPLEEYANLTLKIQGLEPGQHAVVEVVDKGDKVIKQAPVVDGVATLLYINPNTVYARLYIDKNANGMWDTGSVVDSVQPEDVFYFPKKIKLRKNWDVTQDWDIYATAVDMQKPLEIKKNKPKLKNGEKQQRTDDDEDDEDDYMMGMPGQFGTGNNRNGRNNGRGNNRGGMGNMGGLPGLGGLGGGNRLR